MKWEWKLFFICAVVVSVLILFGSEREVIMTGKQLEAFRSMCEKNEGLLRVEYKRESDAENLDFDSRFKPVRVVCKDHTRLSVPKRLKK